jgi:hypothetical protein
MEINQLIKNKARYRHGIDLLKYDDLIEIINECKSKQIKIIAIEAFLLSEEKIQPLMEKSIDFSSGEFNWTELNEYLESVKNFDYMFELIID